MKIIVGLGNPGEKYVNTRHNVGFMVADRLLKDLASLERSNWQKDVKSKAEIAKVGEIILVKPQTFMNACGWAVAKILRDYDINPPAGEAGILSDLWVIHDDLDLPLGKIKIRQGGGTAGHHGLESIVEHLGTTDFIRFRLGVGRPRGHDKWEKLNVKRREIEKYVLSDFTPEEGKEVSRMVKRASQAIQVALTKGLETAMNRFNP